MYLFAVVTATLTLMWILHYKSHEDDHGMWD